MSGRKCVVNSNNLFADDDVDDDTFISSYGPYRSKIQPPASKPASSSYGGGHIADLERQRQAMLERQREIEQRTLDSSARSLGLLRDSEGIGIATAEELARQREQLQNTNKRLDDINTNLTVTQKHLNGIKSVFYGLKNYISGKSDPTTRVQTSPNTQSTAQSGTSSQLNDVLYNMSDNISSDDHFRSHPSTRLRGLDETGTEPVSQSKQINQMLDANLDEMLHSISRLKGLGMALGEEIEQQNELIDNIQDKVEGADLKIGSQNKQMNKLLGK